MAGTHTKVPLIVLTGGPSAGKTAILEMVRRMVCAHVAMVPESAGILFSGGFWRLKSDNGRRASQRAIFHVQRELENIVFGEPLFKAGVCDRGTLDGLAYWPGDQQDFLRELKVDLASEFARYTLVIHLRTPSPREYNYSNPLRIETPEAARAVDERIEQVWAGHPNRIFIENQRQFIDKANEALHLILKALPKCCEKAHKTVSSV